MTITDKMLHFSISFLAFATIFLYGHLLGLSLFYCYGIAFLGAMALGIVKEIIDSKWDWKDIRADIIGIIISGILIAVLIAMK